MIHAVRFHAQARGGQRAFVLDEREQRRLGRFGRSGGGFPAHAVDRFA